MQQTRSTAHSTTKAKPFDQRPFLWLLGVMLFSISLLAAGNAARSRKNGHHAWLLVLWQSDLSGRLSALQIRQSECAQRW